MNLYLVRYTVQIHESILIQHSSLMNIFLLNITRKIWPKFSQIFGTIFAWQFSQQLVPNSAKILWNKRHFDSNFFVEKKFNFVSTKWKVFLQNIFIFYYTGLIQNLFQISKNKVSEPWRKIKLFRVPLRTLNFQPKFDAMMNQKNSVPLLLLPISGPVFHTQTRMNADFTLLMSVRHQLYLFQIKRA